MSGKWSAAKHCHSALSLLLNDLSTQFNGAPSSLTTNSSNKRTFSTIADRHPREYHPTLENVSKRQRSDSTREENNVSVNDRGVFGISDNDDSVVDFTTSFNMALQGYNDGVHPPWTQDQDLYGTRAYAHDIFGRVSCENLFQDEGYQNGFWNGYQ